MISAGPFSSAPPTWRWTTSDTVPPRSWTRPCWSGSSHYAPAPTSSSAALDAVLTDFTTADLSGQDLKGAHLRGIRWSILTTRWPRGWETAMVDSSVPVDADRYPDLYEVRDDPRLPAEVPVW
jgi:hypothetical protein